MSTRDGRRGEDAAAGYLARRGYRILGRNQRLGRGELDIVAANDVLLLFVEVKSHKTRESGLLAMHPDKCERLRSAAEAWLARHPDHAGMACRFDLMIVTPRIAMNRWLPPAIEHIEDIIR